MPYVDLPHTGQNDYASFWYITNSPTGFVSSFDPAKPTILFIHPSFMDTSWLNRQFEDPRLDGDYNLIAFDSRHCGKSLARLHLNEDSWTSAAELAMAFKVLSLSAAHVWASDAPATHTALRFAALFPEMCLSVTLLTVPPMEPKNVTTYHVFQELAHMWCYAEEIRILEHVFVNIVNAWCGPDLDADMIDELIAHLETHYPPGKRALVTHLMSIITGSSAVLTPTELAAVTQPMLIVHGDAHEACSIDEAHRFQKYFVNARGGAKVYFIKGAHACLGLIPSTATIANRVFARFLSNLPHARSDPSTPTDPLELQMSQPLLILSKITDDKSVLGKNPLHAMSFSRIRPEEASRRARKVKEAAVGQSEAFSPLASNGRPVRRYSERMHDHWFNEVDAEGMSYAGELGDSFEKKAREQDKVQPDSERSSDNTNTSGLLDTQQNTLKKTVSRQSAISPIAKFLRV
ncbi:alpha/beta-hydrolase [Auriscalpium vulgare]|uniref:Alpha/beta-hydrolase n=1 Tax=Auriscalpium vulgare TaxID=40419 RepID=A0ACB8S9K6_9AGAM|nr:alpha/beta-hydrolase [Auriscalpium vulgare]